MGFHDVTDLESLKVPRYNPLRDLMLRKLDGPLMKELYRLVTTKECPSVPGDFRKMYPTIWDLVERYK